ncbi:MAG: hypothetical protein ACRD2L_09475, partial [Terriglobia bacterium]
LTRHSRAGLHSGVPEGTRQAQNKPTPSPPSEGVFLSAEGLRAVCPGGRSAMNEAPLRFSARQPEPALSEVERGSNVGLFSFAYPGSLRESGLKA